MNKFIIGVLLLVGGLVHADEVENCYATLTYENDLYIPGIMGYSIHLKRISETEWVIDEVNDSSLTCSGEYSWGFIHLPDVRGIHYSGFATFLLYGDKLTRVLPMGPVRQSDNKRG